VKKICLPLFSPKNIYGLPHPTLFNRGINPSIKRCVRPPKLLKPPKNSVCKIIVPPNICANIFVALKTPHLSYPLFVTLILSNVTKITFFSPFIKEDPVYLPLYNFLLS